ncbi:ArnT family glycosyltransferase [Filimonas effusa]|uniref:Glycosyltransferase RgtA/B/C/D-like domain-containing protein n=1 Tax=Filimonas effusa TaxID=2508721 RepID=A0A4Q1DAL2_9BACT|nr:glycosyltransferase family 39 protein [Filimonas effusa]RXK85805.1 hypothetical protein ESB13_03055 [Filimonas effusa]
MSDLFSIKLTAWIRRNTGVLLIVFFILYALSVFINMGIYQLMAEEPRRGTVSFEMYFYDSFVHPTLMGVAYYNKPPLFNWLLIGLFKVLHSYSEWVVRLPSLLSMIAIGILLYRFTVELMGRKVAVYATLIMLTFVDVYFYATYNGGEIDLFYALLVICQLFPLINYYMGKTNAYNALVLSYGFMALGCLTKGLPSLLFQGATLFLLALYQRSPKILFSMAHAAGLATAAVVIGCYLYAFSRQDHIGILLATQIDEAADKSAAGARQERLWSETLQYPLLLIKGMLPWSLSLLLLVKMPFSHLKNKGLGFIVALIGINIPVYWFTGIPKLRYIYPLMPFFAIVFAWIIYRFETGKRRYEKPVLAGVIVIMITGVAGQLALTGYMQQWWGLVPGLALGVITLLVWRNRLALRNFKAIVVLLAVVLVTGRFFFSMVIVPYADVNAAVDHRHIMEQIDSITGGKGCWYYAAETTRELRPLPGGYEGDTIPVAPAVPYQLPYYYNKQFARPLVHSSSATAGDFYLAKSVALPDDIAVAIEQRFEHVQGDDDYVLFRVADNKTAGSIGDTTGRDALPVENAGEMPY